jgi:hypothetical protein
VISEQEFTNAIENGASFVPVITSCKYHPTHDEVEIITPKIRIFLRREEIEEFRNISAHEMRTLHTSAFGIHVEEKDIDINSASLIICIAKQLEDEAKKSL